MIYTIFGDFTVNELLRAAGFVVGGILVGILFGRIVLGRLRALAARSAWEGDDIIIQAVHGVSTFWFTVAGLYFGLVSLKPPKHVLGPAQHIVLFLILFSATVVAARIGAGLAGLYSRRAVGADRSVSIFTYFARLLIYIIGFLIILQSFGVSITPILTALGVGGLAVALALQDTLSNLFAGLSIIAVRKVRVGEFIRLDSGQDGYVSDITWRYTEIRQLAGNIILIPNSKLANAIVTNFYRPEKDMGISVSLAVGYDADLEKVERVCLDVAREVMRDVDGGVPDAEPSVRFSEFGDWGVRLGVNLRTREFVDQFLLKHEFIKRLKQRFDREGIAIPLPARALYFQNELALRDGQGTDSIKPPARTTAS